MRELIDLKLIARRFTRSFFANAPLTLTVGGTVTLTAATQSITHTGSSLTLSTAGALAITSGASSDITLTSAKGERRGIGGVPFWQGILSTPVDYT